jgi:hypothetical protein
MYEPISTARGANLTVMISHFKGILQRRLDLTTPPELGLADVFVASILNAQGRAYSMLSVGDWFGAGSMELELSAGHKVVIFGYYCNRGNPYVNVRVWEPFCKVMPEVLRIVPNSHGTAFFVEPQPSGIKCWQASHTCILELTTRIAKLFY